MKQTGSENLLTKFNMQISVDKTAVNNFRLVYLHFKGSRANSAGPGCSKLTTSLFNVSLKFQMFISEICRYFMLKKC